MMNNNNNDKSKQTNDGNLSIVSTDGTLEMNNTTVITVDDERDIQTDQKDSTIIAPNQEETGDENGPTTPLPEGVIVRQRAPKVIFNAVIPELFYGRCSIAGWHGALMK